MAAPDTKGLKMVRVDKRNKRHGGPGRQQTIKEKRRKASRNRKGLKDKRRKVHGGPCSQGQGRPPSQEDILAKETEFSKDVAPIHGVAIQSTVTAQK